MTDTAAEIDFKAMPKIEVKFTLHAYISLYSFSFVLSLILDTTR